jgi:hypothetical protein
LKVNNPATKKNIHPPEIRECLKIRDNSLFCLWAHNKMNKDAYRNEHNEKSGMMPIIKPFENQNK